jgi:tRNA A37 threonylcarbamoyladenosine biosynthesis protein TsaE
LPLPSQTILRKFEHKPTKDQESFFRLLDSFLDTKKRRSAILLKGYAGTGKTTLLHSLVATLPLFNFKSLLLAPTGRAAKVMSHYTGKSAFTIHKIMFKPEANQETGAIAFKLQKNYSKNTVFVIDEASMLSTVSEYGKKPLLDQIVDFVFSEETNRLLIIGDDAQLPPVGQQVSNSLDASYLKSKFRLNLEYVTLREVIRQQSDSGILHNATGLRNELLSEKGKVKFEIARFKDTFRMTSERLEDGLRYAYDKYGTEDTMVICRSNKSAVQYNRYIRSAVFYYENELEVGDILMISRNNYFYLDDDSPTTFLANGDFVEIMRVIKFEELYDYRFANLELRLLDYPNAPFEAKIILDTLYQETPAMTQADQTALYNKVAEDYQDLADPKERIKAIKNDPYLNALQVKYAYALTCHKSQGGQWKAVFVDQGYLKEEMVNNEYIRWLYTAITRASDQLFLLNFHEKFFTG